MSGSSRAWIVAASIGAVEALKDQGVCRWNHSLRSIHQHVKNNFIIRSSSSQANKLSSSSSSSSSSAISNNVNRSNEDKMRKVMDLSCFGPSTTRFQIFIIIVIIFIFLKKLLDDLELLKFLKYLDDQSCVSVLDDQC